MPVKREPAEPQGFIKPNGVGIPALQDGEEVKLFFAVDRLKEDSWHTGPYGFDALKERGLVDFGQHDRIITDEGHCVRETYACRPGEHADDRETGDSRI